MRILTITVFDRGDDLELHEILRVYDDVGRAVAIRAFEFKHDLDLGVAAQAFVGERGAGDVAAQSIVPPDGILICFRETTRLPSPTVEPAP